jgi:hypothetical protein
MTRAVILLAASLTAMPAWGQPIDCTAHINPNAAYIQFPCPVPPNYEDGTMIGHAMTICAKHMHEPTTVYPEGGVPLEYDSGWDACNKIRTQWNTGEMAKRLREQQSQEQKEKAEVEGIAQGLK